MGEDGGIMALRNVGILPHHNPEDHDLNFHGRETLKRDQWMSLRKNKDVTCHWLARK